MWVPSLRSKLRLGFGVVIAVGLVTSAYAYWTVANDIGANDWVEHTNAVIQAGTRGEGMLNDAQARYYEFLLTGSGTSLDLLEVDLAQLDAELDHLAILTADNPSQVQRWQAIRAAVDALNTTTLQPNVAARRELQSSQPPPVNQDPVRAGFNSLLEAWGATLDVEQSLLTDRTRTANEQDTRVEEVLIGGAIALIVLGVLCARVLWTSIGQPLARLARVAQAIAAGDLDRRIALRRGDEIGRAADAFDTMATTLQRDLEHRARIQAETTSVLNAAAEGIFGLDGRGRVTMMNAAAEQITGYSFAEVQGKSLHALVHHSHADGSPYPPQECPTRAAMIEGEARHVRSEVFWRKDGKSFPVEYTAVPIQADGHINGAVLTFHDITQQLAVERMKDEFIGVVSHELRTPLTSIRASLGLMSAGMLGPLPDKAKHLTEIALNNTERLVRLVGDILDIERIESGTITLNLQPDDARDLVARAIEILTPVAAVSGISLISEAESIPVCVDSDRIVQALTNLLGNAVKFSASDSAVIVKAYREQDLVHFCVRDHGRGVPPDKLETIFQPFEQVDVSDAKHKGGTGLGLPIARSIIGQHGGEIWVESELGAGSTFHFTLPISG